MIFNGVFIVSIFIVGIPAQGIAFFGRVSAFIYLFYFFLSFLSENEY